MADDHDRDATIAEVANVHLPYEIGMLYRTLEGLERRIWEKLPETDRVTVKNALLESCAIHARALSDFVRNKKKVPTDVTACDLACPNFSAKHVNSTDNDLWDKINKTIVHITEMRSKHAHNKITARDLRTMYLAIRDDLNCLFKHLPPRYRTVEWAPLPHIQRNVIIDADLADTSDATSPVILLGFPSNNNE